MSRDFTPVAGNTHHIVLSDGTTTLGLMSADKMQTFRRVPVARTSLKMSSGDTLYSDMEEPYRTIMQNDWSGGRAQKDLHDDKGRFYDSSAIDTRFKNKCFLGPKVHRTTALPGIPYHEPGNVTDVSVPNAKIVQDSYMNFLNLSSGEKICQSFTAEDTSIASVAVYVNSPGATGSITVHIRADNGSDLPDTDSSLGSASGTVTQSTTEWVTATFSSVITVVKGTTYWLCVEYNDASCGIRCQTSSVYSGGFTARYAEASWTSYSTYDMAFRVFFTQTQRAISFNYAGSGSYTVSHVQVYLKKSGTVTPTVSIYTDDSGPDTLVKAKTLTDAQVGTTYGWVYVDLSNQSLSYGTTYWLVVTDATQREAPGNMLYWAGDAALGYSGGSAMSKVGSAAWAADSTYDYYFRINSGEGFTNDVFKIFEYRGALYAVDAPQEGTDASALWLNGDRGVADSNSGAKGTLVDASKSWTVNEWAGCIVKIITGPGRLEWRTIVSNTATALTVDTDWTVTHTTATEYVIVGSDKWTNVSPVDDETHDPLPKPVTDVIPFYGFLFFAFGDQADGLIYQAYQTGGAYVTRSVNNLGGYTEQFWKFAKYTDRLYASAVKGAYPDDGTWVYYAEHEDWGTDLDITVNKRVEVGEPASEITGMCFYEGDLWIAKEDGLWVIKGSKAQLVLDYRAFTDAHNGKNMCKHNVYLLVPVGYGLLRIYGLQTDNIGPDRDEGLPEGRQGYIDALLPVPGMLYAVINGGTAGTSSILAYNELGWHEVLRGDAQMPITCMHLQVIPDGPNRLWFGMDNNACYVNMPSKGLDPSKDSDCDYSDSGELITSWIDLHLADVDKYFKDLKVVSEGLSTGSQTITAYYQTNTSTDDDAWTLIGVYDTSPVEEQSIGNRITGRRIRFKFVFSTDDDSKTPKMLAWTLDALARVEPKSRWEPSIVLKDKAVMLDGTSTDPQTREEIITQLETWAGNATPLTMTTVDPAYTNKTVFLEPFVETIKSFQSNKDGIVSTGRLVVLEA